MWIFLFAFVTNAQTLSMTVGRLDDHILTSREVQMGTLMERALSGDGKNLKLDPLDSKVFSQAINDTLLELALAIEAKNFDVVQVQARDVEATREKIAQTLGGNPAWKSLGPEPREWHSVLERKLTAKEFVRFRRDSSQLPVTDAEAKRYFEENRVRFGTLPFDNFSENIKSYLTRSQVDRRLKDWYEVIRSKYKAKNYLSEL